MQRSERRHRGGDQLKLILNFVFFSCSLPICAEPPLITMAQSVQPSRRKKWPSCDTFVVLPPASSNKGVIFGKNSDRPENEVQEVVYLSAADHEPGSSLMVGEINVKSRSTGCVCN